MKNGKSMPGFLAKYSFSNQSRICFNGTSKVNNTTSLVTPATSCEACHLICLLRPFSHACRQCRCDPPV